MQHNFLKKRLGGIKVRLEIFRKFIDIGEDRPSLVDIWPNWAKKNHFQISDKMLLLLLFLTFFGGILSHASTSTYSPVVLNRQVEKILKKMCISSGRIW